jgi:hypothetical protein
MANIDLILLLSKRDATFYALAKISARSVTTSALIWCKFCQFWLSA